jgi:TIGR00252 family protein
MSLVTKKFGSEGEKTASVYLKKKGFEIIETNFRLSNRGEIDIIAKDGNILVFIEVKSRKNLNYGEPEYSVTKNKMNQIKKLANLYLYTHNILEVDCRFDVVTILEEIPGEKKINHLINAFN